MENNKNSSGKLNQLSLNQKMELFQVEELEDRLEMAAIAPEITVNGACVQW